MNINAQEEVLMDIKGVCTFLKISKGTLNKLPIPKIKIRRRVLYKKSAIIKFVNDNTKGVKIES